MNWIVLAGNGIDIQCLVLSVLDIDIVFGGMCNGVAMGVSLNLVVYCCCLLLNKLSKMLENHEEMKVDHI